MSVMALLVPSAGQCFAIGGPLLSIFLLVWLIRHGTEWVERIFPHWEWEKRLGWLNLRTQQRAASFLRWVGYLVHGGLLVGLIAIVSSASNLGALVDQDTSSAVANTLHQMTILGGSLFIWILYLVTVLAPKMQATYEAEELERFRKENPDPKEAERANRHRRVGGITVWDSPIGSPPKRR